MFSEPTFELSVTSRMLSTLRMPSRLTCRHQLGVVSTYGVRSVLGDRLHRAVGVGLLVQLERDPRERLG
jgi:hypothetical protein